MGRQCHSHKHMSADVDVCSRPNLSSPAKIEITDSCFSMSAFLGLPNVICSSPVLAGMRSEIDANVPWPMMLRYVSLVYGTNRATWHLCNSM